jgi:trehalose 6-phosphate synthase
MASNARPTLSRTHTSEYLPDEMDLGNAKHLVVVSNRLPVTISKDAKGEYHFKMSSGGLVSALSGLKRSVHFTWIGWTGFFIPHKDREIVDKRLREEYSCLAVYLDDDVADKHYNGFSNSILWPLFHYHPGEMNFDESHWLAYRQANLTFAEAVMTQIRSDSMVWVQDYHLMLLPLFLRGMIQGPASLGESTETEYKSLIDGLVTGLSPAPIEKSTGVKIGFFLHTPFPSSEIYRFVIRPGTSLDTY